MQNISSPLKVGRGGGELTKKNTLLNRLLITLCKIFEYYKNWDAFLSEQKLWTRDSDPPNYKDMFPCSIAQFWKKRFYTRETIWGIRVSPIARLKFLTFFMIGWDDWIKKRVNYIEVKRGLIDVCYITQNNALFVSLS